MKTIRYIVYFLSVVGIGKMAEARSVNNAQVPLIYKPGKVFVYDCSFYSEDQMLIEKERVYLRVLGGVKTGSQNQLAARWEYEAYPELDSTLTICIQDSNGMIFLHQPRHGKYLFTEICDFPSVRLSLYVNLKAKGKS